MKKSKEIAQFDNIQTKTTKQWIDDNESLYLLVRELSEANPDITDFADKIHQLFNDLYKPTPQMGGKYVEAAYAMHTIVNWVQIAQSFRDDLVFKKG